MALMDRAIIHVLFEKFSSADFSPTETHLKDYVLVYERGFGCKIGQLDPYKPDKVSLWHGYMMMVSFAMLPIESIVTTQLSLLLGVLSTDEMFVKNMHGLAHFLYASNENEVG